MCIIECKHYLKLRTTKIRAAHVVNTKSRQKLNFL